MKEPDDDRQMIELHKSLVKAWENEHHATFRHLLRKLPKGFVFIVLNATWEEPTYMFTDKRSLDYIYARIHGEVFECPDTPSNRPGIRGVQEGRQET